MQKKLNRLANPKKYFYIESIGIIKTDNIVELELGQIGLSAFKYYKNNNVRLALK